jgi:hypothetical protein
MSSLILRQFIRNLVVEALDTGGDSELSEVQKGMIRDQLSKSAVFRGMRLDVDDFADLPENTDDWSAIFSNGPIKYLGSGRQGTAFSLGSDKILKLQPGAPRASEIEDALYSGSDIGGGLPNILSTGIFKSNIGDIGWSITEKVQDADNIGKDADWKVLWSAISNGIESIVKNEKKIIDDEIKSMKKKGMSPQEISAMITYAAEQGLTGAAPTKFTDRSTTDVVKSLLPMLPKDTMAAVEQRYRLTPDWFTKFVKGIQNHYKLGMVDFKPDNMGVRRVRGGEGEVIFFDAASAVRRNIKKWEPKA